MFLQEDTGLTQTFLVFCVVLALAGCSRTIEQQPERTDADTDTVPSTQVSETAPEEHSPATEDAQTGDNQGWLRKDWTHNRRHFKKWREEFKQMHKDFDRIIFELEDRPEEEDKEEKRNKL